MMPLKLSVLPVNVLLGKLLQCVSFRSIIIYLFRNSASCTHVSAILHALVGMTANNLNIGVSDRTNGNDKPVTSYLCQWKVPKKRKESTIPMAAAVFEKHDYHKQEKRKVSPTEDFDPRPAKYRGTAPNLLPALLDDVYGESLGISLLLDPKYRQQPLSFSGTEIPSLTDIRENVTAFKRSLEMTAEQLREIEQKTREQRNSHFWFSVRRYRLTASHFGEILRRKADTPPDKLVLRILNPQSFSSDAIEWGIRNESKAIQSYIEYKKSKGLDIVVGPSGFLISETHPFLGATPDGVVYDPSDLQSPFGYLEVKCSYTQRNCTPLEACSSPGFCCTSVLQPDGSQALQLRRNHIYLHKFKDRWVLEGGLGATSSSTLIEG